MSETVFLEADAYEDFLARFDCFLFDCDGVIWEGNTPISGAKEALSHLRARGKKVLFVTNNATKSRKTFKHKFDELGIEARVEEIFGSAYATAAYLKQVLKFPEDKFAYILGEEGIEAEFDEVGIKHKGGTNPDDNVFIDGMDFKSIVSDSSIGAVVCGLDVGSSVFRYRTPFTRNQMHINYKKLARAFRYLQENEGCHFILTNAGALFQSSKLPAWETKIVHFADSTLPVGKGEFYPGAGSLSAPLRYMLPHKEPIIVGKPNQPMLDAILSSQQLDPARTCMVGDRLDTDLAFGKNGGLPTLMVLTGVNSRADFETPDATVKPDYCIDSIGLFRILKPSKNR